MGGLMIPLSCFSPCWEFTYTELSPIKVTLQDHSWILPVAKWSFTSWNGFFFFPPEKHKAYLSCAHTLCSSTCMMDSQAKPLEVFMTVWLTGGFPKAACVAPRVSFWSPQNHCSSFAKYSPAKSMNLAQHTIANWVAGLRLLLVPASLKL